MASPIRAKDYLITTYIHVSDNIVNPFSKQFYRENIAQIAMYDDLTLSISLPEAKIYAPVIAGAINPSSPKFYSEYGPDYAERYQWRFPPTTGAYEVLPGGIVNGVSITQTHVKNWWAKDRKYYKYRFNPDKLVHTVVRDESKAFELFRAGELDSFLLTLPQYWYEKSEVEPVYKGYIDRYTFYSDAPRRPAGYISTSAKAAERSERPHRHQQHAMNWQKVIDVLFRAWRFPPAPMLLQRRLYHSSAIPPSSPGRKFPSVFRARRLSAQGGMLHPGRTRWHPRQARMARGCRLSVSYPGMPLYDRMFAAILREEAKSCGLRPASLDGLEENVSLQKGKCRNSTRWSSARG